MLRKGEEESIVAGTWQIDCRHIQLSRRSPEPRRMRGPGRIFYSPSGALIAKVLVSGRVPAGRRREPAPGKFESATQLYDLEALDQYGRKWTAAGLRLAREIDFSTSLTSVETKVSCLTEMSRATGRGNSIRLATPEILAFPGNVNRQILTLIGKKLVSGQNDTDVAEFEALGHPWRLTRRPDSSVLEITAPADRLDPGLEHLVTDALQFVLARPIRWVMREDLHRTSHRVEIRARYVAPVPGRVLSPFPIRDRTKSGATWKAVAQFASYASQHKEEKRHPLAARVCDVLDAASCSIEVHALVLASAIEGTVSEQLAHLIDPPEDVSPRVEKAVSAIAAAGLDAAFKERATAVLKDLRRQPPRRAMRQLQEKGYVGRHELAAWSKLRPLLAHGQRVNWDRQELVDTFMGVLTLFNQLILAAIDYRGPYTNYRTHGWPTRRYAPKKATTVATPS